MTTRRVPVLRRVLLACATLALVGLVLAGCGGSAKVGAAGAAGTDGRAAQAFPASTVVFVDANIDDTSTAWKQLIALGARFPSWAKLVAQFNASANEATNGGPTLTQLRSWLGTEVAFGVLDVPAAGADPKVLGFAEVRDKAQLERALTKDKDTSALGTHGGYDLFGSSGKAIVAVSSDTALVSNDRATAEAAIDRLGGSGDKLSDDSGFKDTLASLPSDNLVVGYAPGSALQKLVQLSRDRVSGAAGQALPAAQMSQISSQLAGIRALGFSLGATDKGLRMRGTALLNSDAKNMPAAYQQTLLSRVPANSWFAASFGDAGSSAKSAVDSALGSNPAAKQQVAQVEAALGIKLDDIYALISGEHAVYAGPGAPLSAGLLLHPADIERGKTTLKALTKLLTQQGIKTEDTADGQSALIQGFAARWRAVDGVIAIGTDEAVGNATKDSIVDADKFKRVLAEDGVDAGSKTLGLAYVDVPSLINLASAFGGFNGAGNAEALDNLKHVGGLLFWSGRDGDTVTSDVFVEST
jgi:Protein of unknown function (DUF3352)